VVRDLLGPGDVGNLLIKPWKIKEKCQARFRIQMAINFLYKISW
jgi:hypothetical protein